MGARALLVWAGLLVMAVLNGAFRELVLSPAVGPRTGHVLSTLMLCAAILAVTLLTIRWIRPEGAGDAVIIGLSWLFLTLVFEFGFGRLQGKPWSELLLDYDVLQGRIWMLVLVITALAPFLAARARHLWSAVLR